MCGVSGCRYANISLHMQGSTRICAASFDHRNIPRERGGHPFIHSEYRYPRIIFPANAGVFLTTTAMLFAEFDIPRERGGLPIKETICSIYHTYSPRTRGLTYGGMSGCRYANIPLRKQGCPILADIGNLSIRLPPALAGMFRRTPNSNNLLRSEFPVRGVGSQKQMPLSTYHAFSLLSQSWLKRKEEGCPVGARLALHWQGPFNRQ